MKNKWHLIKRVGFTLAEVLITLGIIGIVAEITIPTLSMGFAKQSTATLIEKTYSTLYQAIKLSEVDNGPVSTWDFNTNANTITGSQNFFNIYFKPYLVDPRFCTSGGDPNKTCGAAVSGAGVNYSLSNGVGFAMVLETNEVYIILDTNGAKKPNSMGKDVFYYTITPSLGLEPYCFIKGVTRDQIISGITCEGSTSACNSSGNSLSKHACTFLLMFDSWQVKDDYPW